MKRWNNLPLRFRLTFLYVCLLGLLMAVLGALFYYDVRSFLIDSTATRLRAQAKPIVDESLQNLGSEADVTGISENLSRAITSRDTTAVVLDAEGEYLADGRRLEEESPPVPPNAEYVEVALGGDNEVEYIDTASFEERMLVLFIPLRSAADNDDIIGAIQLNTPLTFTDELLSQERLLIGTGIVIALAVGTLGGFWITGSALSPLRRMVATCRRVASGDLGERVNLPHRKDEVGQLAAAFDDMAERIEATFAAQRRFTADAAHELRTPLTALGGSLEVLMRGSKDDPEATNRLIQGMHREVLRLGRLAEQLLDMSRLEAPMAMNHQDSHLAKFFEEFSSQAGHLARDRSLAIEEGPPSTILHADPDTFKQALFNLTDNAAQHTPPGGKINLGWSEENGSVEVWVADEGEGIPPDNIPHIFEPFYRGDRSRSRRRGGAGLGLALVKNIVESHGGKVHVESEEGKGSRFTIALPKEALPSRKNGSPAKE
ncbi:MAG: HAMP domain-containing histidine kinase [Rubrobacter sp.]|nr:HAMP domain-containing histidine kinase [Rubrobacter sp.]